jgi:hypothetical protein
MPRYYFLVFSLMSRGQISWSIASRVDDPDAFPYLFLGCCAVKHQSRLRICRTEAILAPCVCPLLLVIGPNSASICCSRLSLSWIYRSCRTAPTDGRGLILESPQHTNSGWIVKDKNSMEAFCRLRNGPGGHSEIVLAKGYLAVKLGYCEVRTGSPPPIHLSFSWR